LDLTQIKKPSQKKKAKDEIGTYILKEINKHLNASRSPVSGESFKKLSPKYKALKKKAGAGSRANLLLDGDMRSQITFESYQGGLEIGVFDETEAQKADNHNKNSAKSKNTGVPHRPFIPKKKESFNEKITTGVEQILDKYSKE